MKIILFLLTKSANNLSASVPSIFLIIYLIIRSKPFNTGHLHTQMRIVLC